MLAVPVSRPVGTKSGAAAKGLYRAAASRRTSYIRLMATGVPTPMRHKGQRPNLAGGCQGELDQARRRDTSRYFPPGPTLVLRPSHVRPQLIVAIPPVDER